MITLTDTRKAVDYFDAKLEFTTGQMELNEMIERRENISIIDVRKEEDFRKGRIPGSVNLPRDRWDSFEGLSKDRPNIVLCYSQQCHLAANASKLFAEHGYPVMELEGGYEAWQKYSLPIER
jgi:rhodanese-related sulfurtransferase